MESFTLYRYTAQEANLVEEVEDSPDFWSGPVQSYNSPVEHRFLIGLDRSINGLLPDCDRKYVSVRTMPPGCTLGVGSPRATQDNTNVTPVCTWVSSRGRTNICGTTPVSGIIWVALR